MKNLIKKVLKEQVTDKVITKVLSQLERGKIKPPYFNNLDLIGLTEDEIITVLGQFIDGNVDMDNQRIVDKRDYVIYIEESNGTWWKYGYDERGNTIYYENSNGDWEKYEFNERDNITYTETSHGYWAKYEYDENNKLIYKEDSDEGIILDKR